MRRIIWVGESRLVEEIMMRCVQGIADYDFAPDVARAREMIDSRKYVGMYMGSLKICRGNTEKIPRITGTDCDGGLHLVGYAVQRGLRVFVATDAPERTRQMVRDLKADVMKTPVDGRFIATLIGTWREGV
jgi:hypothetical protein